MQLVKGEDIWEELGVASIIFLATPSEIDKQGRLLMVSGEAHEAAKRFSMLPAAFGQIMQRRKKIRKPYGLMHTDEIVLSGLRLPRPYDPNPFQETKIGAFQTRTRDRDLPSTDIVKLSIRMLHFWSDKWPRIVLELPHCELNQDEITGLLAVLPKNVWVYECVQKKEAERHPLFEPTRHEPAPIKGHRCYVPGCPKVVADDYLMCREHWFALPKEVRDEVWTTHRLRQANPRDEKILARRKQALEHAVAWSMPPIGPLKK